MSTPRAQDLPDNFTVSDIMDILPSACTLGPNNAKCGVIIFDYLESISSVDRLVNSPCSMVRERCEEGRVELKVEVWKRGVLGKQESRICRWFEKKKSEKKETNRQTDRQTDRQG